MTGRPASLLLPNVRGSHVDAAAEPLRDVGRDRLDVERAGHPEGPGERSSPVRGAQAVRPKMEPGSTTGQPALGIGHDSPVHDHHTQQLGGQRRGTATHACSDGAETRGGRSMTLHHVSVYLLAVRTPNRITHNGQRPGNNLAYDSPAATPGAALS